MNILILYGTYSGGTLEVANLIAQHLEDHTVEFQSIIDTGPDNTYELQFEQALEKMKTSDLTILGSCTWFEEGKEGQMHGGFISFEKKLGDKLFDNKKFAIFGLGDSNYVHFCRAVDQLEDMVKKRRGEIILPSLRIDRFHTRHKDNEDIKTWSQDLLKVLG